jgi:hypothetical protein
MIAELNFIKTHVLLRPAQMVMTEFQKAKSLPVRESGLGSLLVKSATGH